MVINKHLHISIGSLIVIFLFFGCRTDRPLTEGVPVTGYFDSCNIWFDFGKMITIGDPGNKFMISLPYDWDIREHYTDTLYTIVAANFMSIPIEMNKRMSITATGYSTDEDSEQYYRKELRQLKKDNSIDVEETGTTLIRGIKCFWLRFVQHVGENKAYNLVVYVKETHSNDIYLIQSTVYDPYQYKDKLCLMKPLIESFEIVKE
ncbi:MAG: hypothetical protein KDC05_17520 [Bacteroidales bacterium]|nr:hypothetical protein [Bacteroidales bacterium]